MRDWELVLHLVRDTYSEFFLEDDLDLPWPARAYLFASRLVDELGFV